MVLFFVHGRCAIAAIRRAVLLETMAEDMPRAIPPPATEEQLFVMT